MKNRWLPKLLAMAVLGCMLPATAVEAAVIIFKDGFYLTGTVKQPRTFVVDPGGASFPIPAGFYFVDDGVRRILFTPNQVQEVLKDEPDSGKVSMELKRPGPIYTGKNLPAWKVEDIGEWNSKWQRFLTVSIGGRKTPVDQRLTLLTPQRAKIDTIGYNWVPFYFTVEFGSDQVQDLLSKFYLDKKNVKESDNRLNIIRFLYQAGWLDAASTELESFENTFPALKKESDSFKEQLRKRRAGLIAESIMLAQKVGQRKHIDDELERLAPVADLLDPKIKLQIDEIKESNRKIADKLKQAAGYLKDLSAGQPFFKGAGAVIAGELDGHSLSRLETFLVYAQQFERERKQNRKHSQSAEEVLALAVTGWLQGNAVAEADVKAAQLLWKARQMVLDYQKNADPDGRVQVAQSFAKEKLLPVDVLDRLIQHLPPPQPPEKITADPAMLEVSDGLGEGPAYMVKLPPEYTASRPYPVLILLQAAADNPKDLIARYSALAARYGYILAAPFLGKGIKVYQYTAKEQAMVIGVLRDLRRRFQVDSDRVFLFGWREGATIAWDIGMSHPDLFAGLLPVNGDPRLYATRYAPNAQYLSIYAVEGDMNGNGSKWHRTLFKDFIRGHYPALLVEYKGRASEWYAAEQPIMFDWMNRKTRAHPIRQLGLAHTGGSRAEEFKSQRSTDNRFYWLSADISPRCLATANDLRKNLAIYPAALQGSITTGNEVDLKKEGTASKAKIWYQIDVRVHGVETVYVWLGPKMIDFAKPVKLRVNSGQAGRTRVIEPSLYVMLEDFHERGDRQRLYYAKIPVKMYP